MIANYGISDATGSQGNSGESPLRWWNSSAVLSLSRVNLKYVKGFCLKLLLYK